MDKILDFDRLSVAIKDMEEKQAVYGDLNAKADEAYKEYKKSFELANSIRAELQSLLQDILPGQVETARIR